MSRWLGIDHGAKRIGLAVGNTRDCIASPLQVIAAHPAQEVFRRIVATAREYEVSGIVVGWPINMDGTHGPQSEQARQMALEIERQTQLDVRLWDERLSSFAADQSIAGAYTRKQRKRRQDAVAAAAMLGDFLSSGGPETAHRPGEVDAQS